MGMVLVACSTAAARRLEVEVRPDYREPCNIWILNALPPGTRKSAVLKKAMAPLTQWERQKAASLDAEIKRLGSERKTLEARLERLRRQAAKERDPEKVAELSREIHDIETSLPNPPTPPRLWTSDATPERLGALLAEHGECMAWLSAEGGIFDILRGRYTNGISNLDLILKAHGGDSERVDRGSRAPVMLDSPRLTIGLCPQPEVLRGLASRPDFKGRGLPGQALQVLEERGYVQVIEPPSKNGPGRRPSPVVRVRPDIVKGWG